MNYTDIKQNELRNYLKKYLSDEPSLPLMVFFDDKNTTIDFYRKHFTSLQNVCAIEGDPVLDHKRVVIDNKIDLMENHPELQEVIPQHIQDCTWMLYHRYVNQLQEEHISYALRLHNKLQKPLICFVNLSCLSDSNRVSDSFLSLSFTLIRVQSNYEYLVKNQVDFYNDMNSIAFSFGNPAIYFHEKALEWQRKEFLGDRHLEYVYATLVAWGMNRAGNRGPKMPDYGDFVLSIDKIRPQLRQWKDYRIETMDDFDFESLMQSHDLVDACFSINASSSNNTKIVSCSKVMAHLLPNLVCPMDRQYTEAFFDITQHSIDEEREFFTMVMRTLRRFVTRDMNSNVVQPTAQKKFGESYPKIFDNFIIATIKQLY